MKPMTKAAIIKSNSIKDIFLKVIKRAANAALRVT
jgi:hypothetical protein